MWKLPCQEEEKLSYKLRIPKLVTGYVTCAVTKDGGDDPDATHGAQILSTVSLNNNVGTIRIDGGKGVGRVTKPGLGLPIGAACDKSCAISNDQDCRHGDCRGTD